MNVFLSTRNWLRESGVAVTCSESVPTTMPLSRLYDASAGEWARVLETEYVLSVDLGASRAIRAVAFARCSLSEDAEYRLKLGTTAGGNDVFDSGATLDPCGVEEAVGTFVADLGATYNARYVTLQIDDSGNAAGFIDAAEMWIGAADIAPAVGYDFGATFGVQHNDQVRRAADGTAYAFQQRALRSAALDFSWLTAAESAALLRLDLTHTGAAPVLLVPTEVEHVGLLAMIGLLAQGTPVSQALHDVDAKSAQVTEL